MEKYLERLGLIRDIQLTLEIDKTAFISVLSKQLDPYRYSFFEAFSSSNNKYKGRIGNNKFVMRRKRKVFQASLAHIRLEGTFTESDNPTIINIRLYSWTIKTTLLYVVYFAFYILAYSVILDSGNIMDATIKWLTILALTAHMALLISAPVIVLRRSLRRMSNRIAADLQNLVKQYHNKLADQLP